MGKGKFNTTTTKDKRGGILRNYVPEGTSVLQINKCIHIEKSPQTGHESIRIEFFVHEAENAQTGDKVTFAKNLSTTKYLDSTVGEIADLLRGALASYAEALGEEVKDLDEEDEDGEYVVRKWIFGPEQPLAGVFIRCVGANPKGTYTKYDWSTPANLAELLAQSA